MSKITFTCEIEVQDAIMTLSVEGVKYHSERTYDPPCLLCSLRHNCCHTLRTLCCAIDYIAAHNDDDHRLTYWTKLQQ